jgi:hypothetical protein
MSKLAELFRNNVKKFLDSRGRGSQAEFARALKTSSQAVNNFLGASGEIQTDTLEEYTRELEKMGFDVWGSFRAKETATAASSPSDRRLELIRRVLEMPDGKVESLLKQLGAGEFTVFPNAAPDKSKDNT